MKWTKVIADKFPRQAVYLIKDDDGILEKAEIQLTLKENRITVITYSDPVHFRFKYESEFRNYYDGTLVVRLVECGFEQIPWDVYDSAFQLSIGIYDIFPLLDSKAVSEIDSKKWQRLFDVQSSNNLRMGYDKTKQFIKNIKFSATENKSVQFQENCDFENDLTIFNKSKKMFSDWGLIGKAIGKQRLYKPQDRKFEELVTESNKEFQEFIGKHFDKNLSMVAFKQPNYVNQITSFMARNVNKTQRRQALIVMDGMSFTQWSLIEQWLITKSIKMKTDSIMAWIPSITSVSRQAIFSGKRPTEYSKSIDTTAKEPHHWREFWKKQGFDVSEIKYQRGLGHLPYKEEKLEFKYNRTKIYGCVVDVIDEFMHGARQGQATVQSELKIWLERGYLESMLNDLLALDYDIFITADHGNIEAVGIGQIQQGVLATGRGQRVRTYDDEILRSSTIEGHKETTMTWDSSTLPKKFLPLIAREKAAFVPKDDIIMTHGGTHIEEVFVPFVTVLKRDEL